MATDPQISVKTEPGTDAGINKSIEIEKLQRELHEVQQDLKIEKLRQEVLAAHQERKRIEALTFLDKNFGDMMNAEGKMKKHRSRLPKKHYRRRRSRSQSPKKRYKQRSRSRSPARKNQSYEYLTTIPEVCGAKWIWHFHENKKNIMKLFKNSEAIEFLFGGQRKVRLDKKNVADLSDLYHKRYELCTYCYSGMNTVKNKFSLLTCLICLKLFPDAICQYGSPQCEKIKICSFTYSSYIKCLGCYNYHHA